MTKEDKIEKLRSILSKSKPVIKENSKTVMSINYGFRPEIIRTTTNSFDTIEFDNIKDAVTVIKESKHITNMTEIEMKNDLMKLCNESNIDCNNHFTIRFLTT